MSKAPEGYPFLRIAKQYGLDYGDVLAAAHWLRHGGPEPFRVTRAFQAVPSLWRDMIRANVVQSQVAAGEIDWQTGESL